MENIIESLRKQREQLIAEKGDDLLSRHTSLLEIAIISLYNRLVNRLSSATEQFRASGAIMALGRFARGLVGPDDTVSLVFLKTEPFPWSQNWVDEVVGPLRQAGWNVACLQAGTEELLDRAALDHDLILDLLTGRYVSGNRELVEGLDGVLQAFIERNREDLVQRLRAGVEARRNRMVDPGNWLEPSILETPGGLQDIQAIRAACRIVLAIRCFEDAIFQGYLLRREVDQLQQAEKKYLRFMSLLKMVAGNDSGVVKFGQQELLAEQLGYGSPSGFLPVESFMRELFQTFHAVNRVVVQFGERLQESGHYGSRSEPGPSRELEPGLQLQEGKIVIQPANYPASAASIVHLFAIAAENRLGFSIRTGQWIQHHGNLLETAAGDPEVRDQLLRLLSADSPSLDALRSFYDYGLFAALVPEIGAVHCLVQHDAFHLYPLQEHHFRTLAELKRLAAGEHRQQAPDLTRLAEAVVDPAAVYLAAILHDIGKSGGADHARRGAAMIPTIAQRLGLDSATAETVRFLVGNHLLLMDNASMRDLADQEMVSQCAQQVGDLEQLHLLMLLSFADMVATGPKALQKWQETPVAQLSDRIRYVLEKGEPGPEALADRIARLQTLVAPKVTDILTAAELSTHFAQLAPRYLLSMSPTAIAEHLHLEKQLEASRDPFAWVVATRDDGIEITLLGWQVHGFLAKAAGILTLHHLDIVGAQVFTKKNGVVLLVFQCRAQDEGVATPNWETAGRHMKRLLEGKLALDYRIALHADRTKDFGRSAACTKSRVLIDNDSSRSYTILEVYTTDRVGLLYAITRVLMDLQVRVYVAKITTKIDQVADIFYLQTVEGGKVLDEEQLQEIRNALLFRLDGRAALEGSTP